MMYFRKTALAAALLSAVVCAQPALASLPVADSQGQTLPTLAPMLNRVLPAVVNVATRTRVPGYQNPLLADPFFRHFFDLPQPQQRYAQSLGSGVIVDAKLGYILTNNHVIDGAEEITVALKDGRTLKAKLVGTDPESDIAVIKVEADNLTALPLADSNKLQVGDFVVAIGNPFGLGQTVTSGIVSALSRSGLGIEGYEDFIQTDASINPGNSGGALVNLHGELEGINTAILSKSGGNVGIGFAIPISMAREVMDQLIKYGKVQRGRLGADAQDMSPELAAAFGLKDRTGAVITRVVPKSPAEKAGLRAGDVVIAVNDTPVRDSADVHNVIGLLRVGQKVDLTVMRNGEKRTLHAVIEQLHPNLVDGGDLNPRLAGAQLSNLKDDGDSKSQGVRIMKMAEGSPAWNAGLRPGDVIIEANRHQVTNLDELQAAIGKKQPLLLNIARGNGALFLLIQ